MQNDMQKYYDEMCELFEVIKVDHEKSLSGNASAGKRARKAAGDLKKLVTPYRKASVEASKQ